MGINMFDKAKVTREIILSPMESVLFLSDGATETENVQTALE